MPGLTQEGRLTRATPARVAAARVLIEVEDGAHAEDRVADVPVASRAAAWAMVFGVLRRRGQVDAILRTALAQPLGGLDAPVRAALRLGAWERWIDGRSAHAAVDQAVEVVRALGGGRASGLVNGVLRRASPPETMGASDLANLPEWLWERWSARWPDAAARADRAAEPAPLTTVFQAGSPWPDEVSPTEVPGVGRWSSGGRVADKPGFAEGAWWVADLAAVAVADLVEGERVLDACAAPGGKSFRLTARGARVTAVDRADRLERLREGQRRLRMSFDVVAHDWTRGPAALGKFDAVLVDAPCSGLGTLRRHPEIKWRRDPWELPELARRQATVVSAAAHHVGPRGQLVVAVCSLEPEETKRPVPTGFVVEREWRTPDSWDADGHAATVYRRI